MIQHRKNCRGCLGGNLTKVLDLGEMPLAGGFLYPRQIAQERKFKLKLYFCHDCALVQVLDHVDPKLLFEKYFYISSVIKPLSEHFRLYAAFLKKKYLKNEGSLLLEFGSNDGVLLQNFKNQSRIKAIGIDPSRNVTKLARRKGLSIVTGYFDVISARKIIKKFGQADVVSGSNVFAHVDDIHGLVQAAKMVLKPSGVFIVEVHYVRALIEEFQYDTVYHEHLCYYSVTALKNILQRNGLKLIKVQSLSMHGGGIRVISAKEESTMKPDSSVTLFLKEERRLGLDSLRPFLKFGEKAEAHKAELRQLLTRLKSKGKKIVGYGAPGRGTILLNYCDIGNLILDYVIDESPLRAGKLMPGVHIPVFKPEKTLKSPPDYFLVLAWNYADSILKKEHILREKGVKFIIPFPKISIK